MQRRYGVYNPKRKLRTLTDEDALRVSAMAESVTYGGNPEHKKNPGDFGLTPPSYPRAGKSLCDVAEVFTRAEALAILKAGLEKGLVSEQDKNGWPKNIWALDHAGIAFEAQLENPDLGTYHGYPMPDNDPFADEVRQRWGAQA
jgi:hypothetical protein